MTFQNIPTARKLEPGEKPWREVPKDYKAPLERRIMLVRNGRPQYVRVDAEVYPEAIQYYWDLFPAGPPMHWKVGTLLQVGDGTKRVRWLHHLALGLPFNSNITNKAQVTFRKSDPTNCLRENLLCKQLGDAFIRKRSPNKYVIKKRPTKILLFQTIVHLQAIEDYEEEVARQNALVKNIYAPVAGPTKQPRLRIEIDGVKLK